ncbi:PREDICTED: cyclic nucleotide-gated ion channel 1-like [Prunus mume]|uniref:Cyclic nucleotide-gated ion channel 1-like n=1 Tax=Prunus mume TaxID=102107 RepID=A0ABM1LJX3_PRUMU|nr:PREDICTED: cyclic nucleotide-gated ion channel 1-like [Prunus mume]
MEISEQKINIPDETVKEKSTVTNGGGIPTTKLASILYPSWQTFIVVWHSVFICSCVLSVLVDPLFLYIPIVNEDNKCLGLDKKLKKVVLILRSLTDVFYLVHIIFQYFYGQTLWEKKIKWVFPLKGKISRSCIQICFLIIDILAILPIPQVVIFIFFTKMKGPASLILNFLILFQYLPRVLCIYFAIQELYLLPRGKWVKGIYQSFAIIVVSHVFGALWYFFSIQRETACWQYACQSKNGCEVNSFDCDDDHTLRNITLLSELCPINPSNATVFNFGIFLDSLQSGMVGTTEFRPKLLHYFWWGLRNLSSFGQNLQTSNYAWENLFAIFISLTGMLLFLIYLQGILQSAATTTKFMKMTSKRNFEIRLWLRKIGLPFIIKDRILTSVLNNLDENKDINIQSIGSVISMGLMCKMAKHLWWNVLKEVPGFQTMDDGSLEAICKNFHPVFYGEDSYIIREGEPLGKMVFILQGKILTYATNNNGTNGSTTTICLDKGDIYGEELVKWASNSVTSSSNLPVLTKVSLWDLPISTTTLKCYTEVEAFTLMATDLKKIVQENKKYL